ncbi:TIGR01212 family radical SAM protein [Salisediminibacterium beveridgei]|uniref:Radical SAM core domain-containing protein n=1 Tax=Salisediminibacterium beveridgei TaxID=632773 RepID=A0A1D7QSW2_9BACI|nr:TIGR01212 family radical SAM protein [Salisediminibacterium beveridgei]AOM82106.1 hypothetical protein BBEV_0734 [Salisediminibacterium beveridgei]
MNNLIPSHFGDKRYYTWNQHLRETFGEKVIKVPIDGGFDCPNRDGTIASGGCTFCSKRGSGDFAGDRRDKVLDQFHEVKNRLQRKWNSAKYIAYFQAYTNTYAPVDELRAMFESVLHEEGVVGIAIGTRPDCLPEDVVDYLAELHQRTFLWVELGLQSAHDVTGERINRAHDFACYKEGVAKLRQHGIRVCSHIINGLPGETREMMIETAEAVADLDVQGIKIHLLHVLKQTAMAKELAQGEFRLLDQKEYTEIVLRQLERLPQDLVIHRLTGDGPRDLLIGPEWSLKKWDVLNGIDRALIEDHTWQGKYAHLQPIQGSGSHE